MKVNISGKGVIPGVNSLAPKYGVDLDIVAIKRILNYRQFKVFSSETGLIITKQNIDQLFTTKKVDIIPVTTEKPVDEIKETPKKIEIVETPIKEETYVEPELIIEETNKAEEVIESVDENIIESTDIVDAEEVSEPSEVVDEVVEDKPERKEFNYYKKKKRNH